MSKTVTTRFASFVAPAILTALALSGCHYTAPIMLPLPGTAYPAYTITDLGLGQAYDLSDCGQVIGGFQTETAPRNADSSSAQCFVLDKGKQTVMGTPGDWWFRADTFSGHGQILGHDSIPGYQPPHLPTPHSCLWQNGKTTDLEVTPRFRGMALMHFTQSGAIYAVSQPQGPLYQQHLWFYPAGFGSGGRRDLGVIGNQHFNIAAINDSGQVVGKVGSSLIYYAFLWQKGHLTGLGTLGGMNSEATAINNAGQVVGSAELARKPADLVSATHAFLWENGKIHDLGALPDSEESCANTIDSKGDVVGYSRSQHFPSQAVVWEKDRIQPLGNLIPTDTQWAILFDAKAMNDRGQIVGCGLCRTDQCDHVYLLTPIGYKAGKGETL